MTQTPSFLTPHSNFLTTLKVWPVIALTTIGLCFLTQQVASWFGITLPDQKNIEIVKQWAGWNKTFVLLCAQILVLLPALEELVFRGLLFKLAVKAIRRLANGRDGGHSPSAFPEQCKNTLGGECGGHGTARPTMCVVAFVSSCLFSAAHYIAQPFPDAAFLALAFFGIAQCWLYRKTNRIWCPMLNHALFNLANLVLLFVLPEQGAVP